MKKYFPFVLPIMTSAQPKHAKSFVMFGLDFASSILFWHFTNEISCTFVKSEKLSFQVKIRCMEVLWKAFLMGFEMR
jgi:hypothetical protein